MARYSFQTSKKTERPPASSSPAPAISPISRLPALDMQEYSTGPASSLDGPHRSPHPSLELNERSYVQPEQQQSGFLERSGFTGTYDADALISRQSYHAAGSRTSLFATPPPMGTTTRNPSSVPGTPYLSAFRASSDNIDPPAEVPPQPTSPTAEMLAELGPAPGMGPTTTARQHRKKMQRIAIWAEEVAEVNERQPTKPMPKPLREWERLGRRVLKRRDLDEWPGPMQDGERVDQTGMYGGERPALFKDQYFGPHPSLERGDGTSPAPPTPGLDEESPAFPTRNILIDNGDGAADTPDELKLSPISMSSIGVDVVKKAKAATDERLQRAAKLLAKQTKNLDLNADSPSGEDDDIAEEASKPPQRKKHIDLLDWRNTLARNATSLSTFRAS